VRIVADAFGDPQAPPVVLLPGGGQTRHAWGDTARVLGEHGRYALSCDLRGHGDSEWPPDADYSTEAFVGDLEAVVRALGRAPAIVGASLGGITGLLGIGESEVRVASALVLVDVAPRTEVEGITRIVDFMMGNLDGFGSLEEAADAVASYVPHRPRPPSLEGLRKNLRLGEDGRYRWHWDPRFMTSDRRPMATRTPERLENAARRLRVPTLLVRGRMSDVVSLDGARHFLELVPHARFVDVSGAGHMVAGDENDVFTDAVVRFLEEAR
jgi:non-heme chloroperoxidase